ncbi:MAG: MerR family transcriptional regulator [Candidatus Eisenbacteria bacterium]|nr:MerR family transcriptional regulator [Candidatus Eisenbacteria bacterium]
MDHYWKIGELAKATGKTVRALRLYEQMGLLECAQRTGGNYRLFEQCARERIRWIGDLQAMGLSLPRIKDLLESIEGFGTGRDMMEHLRDLYGEKLGEVRALLERMTAVERELVDTLRYLETCRECDEPKPKEDCLDCPRDHEVDATSLIRGAQVGLGPHNGSGSGFLSPGELPGN